MLALPIFPVRLQTSIFGADELNFRVRDGNGWTLTAINTNLLSFVKESKQRKLPWTLLELGACFGLRFGLTASRNFSLLTVFSKTISRYSIVNSCSQEDSSLTCGLGILIRTLRLPMEVLFAYFFFQEKVSGDPCGNRTHVCGVRGRRLSRLTNGPLVRLQGLEPGTH